MATDDLLQVPKKTVSSHPEKGSQVGDVLKSNAQRNIELVQEYVHKFSEAKDFSDALRVQTEYVTIRCIWGANKNSQ